MFSSAKREWDKSSEVIEKEQQRKDLLNPTKPRVGSVSDADSLLNEGQSIVQSIGIIEGALESANMTHDMLQGQNQALVGIRGKLAGITNHVPGIDSLLSRINNRQFQERLILNIVIGVCISILIWMRLLRYPHLLIGALRYKSVLSLHTSI
jgi:hypothetical protein